MFFVPRMANTRIHSLKLVKPRCRLDIRIFSFTHRVVDNWSGLDESILQLLVLKRADKFVHGQEFI